MVKITPVISGFFKLDGGAMFGVVPKRMWSQIYPADDQNLCTWAMRSLLVEYGHKKVLIDTGIGNKQDDKFRSHFLPFGANAFESLSEIGFFPEDITDVILTHLHFDHVGGAFMINESGQLKPSFPNATYWCGEEQYDWAIEPNEREKASILSENILPLVTTGVTKFIATEINDFHFDDAISFRFVNGHTRAMMLPIVHRVGQADLIYCADLLPSTAHLGLPYVMAYDIEPLKTIEEKKRLLEDAAQCGHHLFLEHDAYHSCISIMKNEKGKFIATDVPLD